MSSEIEIEPIPGLPHHLPPGERILWQGRPEWKALARNTFKVGWLAAYFAVFVTARAVAAYEEGRGVHGLLQVLTALALAGACLAVLSGMAWINARATMYTITTRRIVMRIGVALPTTFNLPFKRLASADVKVRKDGDGDIVLQIAGRDRIAWLHLWPHVHPFHLARARPMLRTIAEPERVASLLAAAVQEWAKAEAAPVLVPAKVLAREAAAQVHTTLATEAGR
jgi:hypothetical protein